MKKSKVKKINALILILLFFGCQKEDAMELSLKNNSIVEAIELYVDRFVEEAKNHGVEVDVSNLIITIEEGLIEDKYCGYGYSDFETTGKPKIIISKECWYEFAELPDGEEQADIEKEKLIFHELGHAILNRSHDYSLLPDGSSKTLMFPNNLAAYSTNFSYKRDYYISELFNPETPIPPWAKQYIVSDTTIFFLDAIDLFHTAWVPNDTSSLNMYVDSIDFASSPYGLSIVSKESNAENALTFQRIVQNTVVIDSLTVQLNLKVLCESLQTGVTIRLFFEKGAKSWSRFWNLNYSYSESVNGQVVNDETMYDLNTGKIENFDQVKVSLERNVNQTGKVTFDDIELFVLTNRIAYYVDE